jgi:hypothetical protein
VTGIEDAKIKTSQSSVGICRVTPAPADILQILNHSAIHLWPSYATLARDGAGAGAGGEGGKAQLIAAAELIAWRDGAEVLAASASGAGEGGVKEGDRSNVPGTQLVE